MNKRAGIVVATGVIALAGLFGTAAMASAAPAGGVPSAAHGRDDSPSPSAPAVPSESPSASPSSSAAPSTSASPSAPPSSSTPPSPSNGPSAPSIISADQAKAIALAASGGGTITKFEFKDGNEYRVEITNGRTEHKIRINAFTGVITRHDVK
ncbi:PepSY domain-containing protein [Actinoplanes sp. N902-109]|uniref:PepSY domain-containing protein n=1 Tax=Actinoplanes sp. (strain N902-109) TaxID=649831 RepID=UPI0003296083|nr:PepSY domain-containing protein [Actinoplanes sp. N902-109]AGL17608.1 hypothetical protein L083_4098 [Actinoplanes sp. N902-109]